MSGKPTPEPSLVLYCVVRAEREYGRPVSIGEVAWKVAPMVGVDTSAVPGMYELRRHVSWYGMRSALEHLVQQGNLVARTEDEWCALWPGGRYRDSSPRPLTRAYASVLQVRDWGLDLRGAEEAREKWALRRLREMHPRDYARCEAEWKHGGGRI